MTRASLGLLLLCTRKRFLGPFLTLDGARHFCCHPRVKKSGWLFWVDPIKPLLFKGFRQEGLAARESKETADHKLEGEKSGHLLQWLRKRAWSVHFSNRLETLTLRSGNTLTSDRLERWSYC